MGEVMMTNSKKIIAVEGVRLVEEALKCGLKLQTLFLTRSLKEIPPTLQSIIVDHEQIQGSSQSSRRDSGVEIHRVSAKLMQTWSSVTTPPGIIGNQQTLL
jgi:hypothetical protein